MSSRSDLAALINLHGVVPSEAERHMSKFAAWPVFGRDQVSDRIDVPA